MFKNKLSLLVFLWGLFVPSFLIGQTIEVCASCNTKSIKQAIKNANKGDTILVKKGTYKEYEIEIEKSLTLKAEPGVIIDGENKGEVLILKADSITVDGFEIIDVISSHVKDFSAIRAKRVKDFVIKNMVIRKPFFAIYIEKSSHGKVLDNTVYGEAKNEFTAGNGIHIWYSNNLEVKNNQVYQMRDGIYLEFSDDNIMDNNISKDNVRYGLHFMFSQNNKVLNSQYINSGAGIAIMFSKHMEMRNNVFKDNWGSASYGVLLKEAMDSEIKYNVFKRNTTGINVEGSNRIIYEHNDFESNGWAIRSRGANYDNKFTNNNFLNNSFDISYNGSINRNSFNGNYWSDYSGYDLDKDGIGDVPYRPVKLFSSVVNKSPEAIILLRSMFIDIIDFAEKVSPVFTPDNLLDETPKMKIIKHDTN